MEINEAKKAFTSAEKEVMEEKVKKLKVIIKDTLEAIEKAKQSRAELDEKIKYLKMDIDDLKEGHIERIEERQSKDEKARKYSLFRVSKLSDMERCADGRLRDTVYVPYPAPIPVAPFTPWSQPWAVWYSTSGSPIIDSFTSYDEGVILSNSIAKINSPGAYDVSGKVINLR